MIWLGEIVAGETVPVRAQFHDDQGNAADPTTPFARMEAGSGTFADLTAPTKRDGKTGYYGVDIDTTGFSAGIRTVRIGGTVATDKTVAAVYGFRVVAHRAESAAKPSDLPTDYMRAADYTAPPTTGEIDAALSATHGSGSWAETVAGDTTLTEATEIDGDGNIVTDGSGSALGLTTPGATLTLYAATDTTRSTPLRRTTAGVDGTWSIGAPSGSLVLVVAKDGYYDAAEGDSVITRAIIVP